MSNIAQLKQQLKSLKLSGTLETIELRLMEATQNQLAFSEMLSMILARWTGDPPEQASPEVNTECKIRIQ